MKENAKSVRACAKRALALEYALVVNRLLDSKVFPTALKAVETKDEKLFEEACEAAGIPKDMMGCLMKVAFKTPMAVEPAW